LSDGTIREEITTTVEEKEPYDIQIQGSDRQHPAIVLRRKHRGKGATIQTISKHGQHSALYADFEQEIKRYVVNRAKRLGKEPTTRGDLESGVVEARERWVDKAIQGVVGGQDNSQGNPDSL
jgi:hypothetical protein